MSAIEQHMLTGFDSPFCSATTKQPVYAQKTRTETTMKKRTQILTWKTHNDGKNNGSPQAAEYTMRETITAMEAQGQRPLAPPLFATRGGYNGGNYLFLSLSLTLYLYTRAIQLLYKSIQQHIKVCALSHIYTYMTFGLFTYLSFLIGRTNRNRVIRTGPSVFRFSLTSIRRDLCTFL